MRAAKGNEKPAAEHAHAADRCAREIAGFLTRFGGALAAADGQSVGPLTLTKAESQDEKVLAARS